MLKRSTPKSRNSKANLNLNSVKHKWHALIYKITNVKDGTDITDASNMQQTLTGGKISFVQGKYKYEFIFTFIFILGYKDEK